LGTPVIVTKSPKWLILGLLFLTFLLFFYGSCRAGTRTLSFFAFWVVFFLAGFSYFVEDFERLPDAIVVVYV